MRSGFTALSPPAAVSPFFFLWSEIRLALVPPHPAHDLLEPLVDLLR